MRVLTATDFLTAAAPQPLAADGIHLWWLPGWGGPARSAAESEPVRALLGAYLGRDRGGLRFRYGPHGKPELADAALAFNLSHSHGDLLLGVSRDTPLGVDLERPQRERPALALAERYFAADEAAALAALPSERVQTAFLRLWACKEAVLKADGGGISAGLDRVRFALGPDGDPDRLVAVAPPLVASSWHVLRLEFIPGHGALAWHGPDRVIRAFRMTGM